jgi:hypothetical protein
VKKINFIKEYLQILILFLLFVLCYFSAFALIPGDFNGDGQVEFNDLMIFALAYGSCEGDENWDSRCDLDPDGCIEFNDLMIFALHYGESTNLKGTVTSDVGGPPVESSLVEAKDGTNIISSTTTDEFGNFDLAGLPYGTYNIIVSQAGKATSKAQDIPILDSQTTVVNLVQKEVNVPTWETNPPTISTTGITEGAVLSGIVACSVGVIDESDIKYIFIGIDYIPSQLENDYSTIVPSFDTTLFPDGDYQLVIVVYDINYNRCQLTLNITIDNASSGTIPETPTNLWPLSVTFGESIGIYSKERNELFKEMNIKEDPNLISLSEDKTVDLDAVINVADPDSNIFVELNWDEVNNATGYKIYRKFEGENNYQVIGSTEEYAYFYDTDPQLSVGGKVYYQVSAYNVFGESERTPEEWTIPLPKFNINLVDPVDGATGVSITPTLQWQPVELVGKYQYFDWYVQGKNDSVYTWNGGGEMLTSWVYSWDYNGDPLQYLKVYEWNVDYAVAYDDSYSTFPVYRAVSIAGDGNGSLNGAFEFTTGSE